MTRAVKVGQVLVQNVSGAIAVMALKIRLPAFSASSTNDRSPGDR